MKYKIPVELKRRIRSADCIERAYLAANVFRRTGISMDELDFLGISKRLGQENHVGMLILNLRNQPCPERQGLGVGIVDPKNLHAHVNPEQDNRFELLPKRLARWTGEIEVDDVLIAFGRIFRGFQGAIGTPGEPLRMFANVRVIRRALKRQIQGNLNSALRGDADKSFEILERTQLWMHRLVAAFRGANCPWAAHVLGPSPWRILAAFSAGAADGVDRRQVQDVEPKVLNVRQNRFAVLEGAVAS